MQAANHEREGIELYQAAKTQDHTVERSFVHILDICDALEKTLEWLKQQQHCYETFNIARDDVISIAELLHEAEEVTGTKIQVLNVAHHLNQGVLDQIGADVTKAKQVLAWTAQRTVAQMLQDQWRFYRGA